MLDQDRIIGNPSVCLGVAEAALHDAAAYVQERKQFGRPLADFQGLQWKLADMAIDIEAGRALLHRAARRLDAGTAGVMDASVTKTFNNEMSVRVTNTAMQLCGAYGLSLEYPFERYLRDVRSMSIGYGTTEIHRGRDRPRNPQWPVRGLAMSDTMAAILAPQRRAAWPPPGHHQ